MIGPTNYTPTATGGSAYNPPIPESDVTNLVSDLAAKATALTAATVRTTSGTATANTIVPVDTTSGAVTVTLPAAPADGTRVVIKHVIQGSTNAVTIACGGSDVFNKTGGSTSGTLSLVNQAMSLQYKSTGAIWYVVADDMPLSGLDGRYPLKSNNLSDLANAATARTNLSLGSVDNTADTAKPVSTAQQTALDAKVAAALFDANTILKADTDDTPAALTVAEQRIVGRITGGVIAALTGEQVRQLTGGSWVRKVRQTLTDKTSFAGTSDEQWGSEFATLDDALLPTTSVTVEARAHGYIANTTDTVSGRLKVEISLDGGSTYSAGLTTEVRDHSNGGANGRYSVSAADLVSGTATGDIKARAIAISSGGAATAYDYMNGALYMEVVA